MIFRSFLIILTGALCTIALTDTTNAGFFSQLEEQLRADYIGCTGDSARLPVKALIRWKHDIDSMAGLPAYAEIARAYQQETGRSPTADRPCAVLQWKQAKDSAAAVAAMEKKQLRAVQTEVTAESLVVYREIEKLPAQPFAFNGIPFGSSKRSFFWIAKRKGFAGLANQGSYYVFQSVPLGDRVWLGAFYFDTIGFCRYELEGAALPVDSLDGAVRSEAAYLASLFEKEIGAPPHQTNRVSRDEIREDEVAIVKAWSQSSWSVAVGLSRHGYRYYAKAVATNRPLPKK
ncbi:MAG: hypothetical protein JXA71_05090 [Chitinispirillaceae bacterium]|nr:hypothetical protein [Chitinispirillaceae bacterium]